MSSIVHVIYFCAASRPSFGGLEEWLAIRFSKRSEDYVMPRLSLYSLALMPLNFRRG